MSQSGQALPPRRLKISWLPRLRVRGSQPSPRGRATDFDGQGGEQRRVGHQREPLHDLGPPAKRARRPSDRTQLRMPPAVQVPKRFPRNRPRSATQPSQGRADQYPRSPVWTSIPLFPRIARQCSRTLAVVVAASPREGRVVPFTVARHNVKTHQRSGSQGPPITPAPRQRPNAKPDGPSRSPY
jgi:hypothetical protein